jgi:hypothetical protein
LPKGAVRPLNDAIFDPSMASVGLYDPQAFGRAAPFSLYALEEDRFLGDRTLPPARLRTATPPREPAKSPDATGSNHTAAA